jgi:aspartyl-tRNA(Asn)/glutamyl-tRNA(Gln) amidotransferase subunit B
MPGTLPVVNRRAMEMGLMVGLALHCEIPPFSQFARKSYFYPDLPKGYQISQYEHPLAINGYMDIDLEDGTTKRIGVTRAHMEEDTGKLTHWGNGSLVDYNRAGVPLLEIVSEPDIRSAAEAEAYARKLRAILQYLGVNHGDMSKGILRFEANVSVMHKDDTEYRQRTEIKNLNSIRSMVRGIEYEVKRQIKLWERGDEVKSATLGWDENAQKIIIQRYKERADEYRYFPDPDLPIVVFTKEQVEEIRAGLPELPDAKLKRFVDDLKLSDYDADILVSERAVADYFEAALAAGAGAKTTSNFMINKLFGLMGNDNVGNEAIFDAPITPEMLAEVMKLYDEKKINKAGAEEILDAMWAGEGDDAAALMTAKGLEQVSDTGAIEPLIVEILDNNPDLIERYINGEDKVFGALMGQSMKALKGKGDGQIVREILQRLLAEKRG